MHPGSLQEYLRIPTGYRHGTGTVINPYYGYRDLAGGSGQNQSLNHLERQLLYGKETNLV